jgi:nucleotide-binding universal stress UspA family protein
MNGFQHVLFPVDFSSRCVATVPFVKEMAAKFRPALTLIHVVGFPMHLYGSEPPSSGEAWDAFAQWYRTGERHLARFRSEHFADVPSVKTVCQWGSPGDGIIAYAEKNGADFIMLPTHGETGFRSFLLGSTTARVLHRAACPVWTGAHLDTEPASDHVQIRKILCAVDLERDSLHVIRAAAELARNLGAEVRLVHCVPAPEDGPTEQFVSEFDRLLADSALQALTRLQAEAGTSFEVSMAGGRVSKVVHNAALAHQADLTIIGRGHVQAAFSRLRTNAYAIIRDAPCPVISL